MLWKKHLRSVSPQKDQNPDPNVAPDFTFYVVHAGLWLAGDASSGQRVCSLTADILLISTQEHKYTQTEKDLLLNTFSDYIKYEVAWAVVFSAAVDPK